MPSEVHTTDRPPLQEILGYLNFSSGASDSKFLSNLNELWNELIEQGVLAEQRLPTAAKLLNEKIDSLAQSSAAFRDAMQARSLIRLLFHEMPRAYRRHHRDLLFHQTDAALWQPFFVGRVAEAILSEAGPWNETERIIAGALARLNDYVGYRPIAALETHKHEPYSHERVRPVPLYIAGAGVAGGAYHELIEQTLAILRSTQPDFLDAADFDLDLVEELAFDPRAYDFNHPANRRPNYHFGGWDPDHIDNHGRYRQFVVQQVTLDAVMARLQQSSDAPREEILFEAGAVLAGTILMASGTSGSGPEAHDSNVSLATLLPKIARYRDEFYQQLFATLQGEHRTRMQTEMQARRQPFAGARQHLNNELARLRALQLQHVQLALLFARLGFSESALQQANVVPAVSARMVCQMQCLLAAARRAADAGQLREAFETLPQVEDLLHRAIQCGAVIDPWNILGFGGQFSLFPSVENSIPDPRVDELVDLMRQIFELYARVWREAAIVDDAALIERLPAAFSSIAKWWDQYATTTVESVPHVSGAESQRAAARVAESLAAWHKAGAAAGKLTFWRPYADQFESPHAYSRVIEALLSHGDRPAGMALLMHWLSQADDVSLGEGRHSFFALCVRWLQTAANRAKQPSASDADRELVPKFIDFLEANAGEFWDVPVWQTNEKTRAPGRSRDVEEDLAADNGGEADEGLFSAAYENMVYRDSTADGTDADMLEGPNYAGAGDDELNLQQQRLSQRLSFLAMLADLWKMAAIGQLRSGKNSVDFSAGSLVAWRARAAENHRALLTLAAGIERETVEPTSASFDALVEYDRRRVVRESILERVIATIVATSEAKLMLGASAGTPKVQAAPSEIGDQSGAVQTVFRAVLRADNAAIEQNWPQFLRNLGRQPLLYVPVARGGNPAKIAAARHLQLAIHELLRRLPRLGMLRETCQLLHAARLMEKNNPQGAGAVTEFDRLFEAGYKAIVESLVESSLDWNSKPGTKQEQTAANGESGAAAQLFECLQQVTESLLSDWLAHSSTLRISVLERISSPKAWDELMQFVERYGHDLFTQQFFHLGNLRAILHQGIDNWLNRLSHDDLAADEHLLVAELGKQISKSEAKRHLSLVIEAVVENYAEYRDYNATTTQSDRGEMLYMLLDFLRVKANYERIHWNLRPVMMAHEVLVRRGRHGAAEMWRQAMQERTNEIADQQLARLGELQTKYAMRLPTVADRLAERFVRPLVVDRLLALVATAAEEAQRAPSALNEQVGSPATSDIAKIEKTPAVALLEEEAGQLADEPAGAGLDLPDWLEQLEEEVNRVLDLQQGWDPRDDSLLADFPFRRLTWQEIQSQLTDWDKSGVGK